MKQSDLSAPGNNRFHFIHMKHLTLSLTLVGIVACSLAGFAQTTSPAGDTTPAAASIRRRPTSSRRRPAGRSGRRDSRARPPQVAANDPPRPPRPPRPANANSAAQPGTVIPLIVMDDVPLTDAIRNLARQAGINYMLDPKIGFGQVGPDGKVTPQPNVSIRWENITAEQALNALLNNYTLQLVEDPKSKIARVTIKDPAAPPPLGHEDHPAQVRQPLQRGCQRPVHPAGQAQQSDARYPHQPVDRRRHRSRKWWTWTNWSSAWTPRPSKCSSKRACWRRL